jgi:hypothetical protein
MNRHFGQLLYGDEFGVRFEDLEAGVRLRECFAVLLISYTSARAYAQSASSPWAGEWGIFKQTPSTDVRRFEGHGLSISDCAEQHCASSVLVENKVGHGNATGVLQVHSDTEAVAVMPFTPGRGMTSTILPPALLRLARRYSLFVATKICLSGSRCGNCCFTRLQSWTTNAAG